MRKITNRAEYRRLKKIQRQGKMLGDLGKLGEQSEGDPLADILKDVLQKTAKLKLEDIDAEIERWEAENGKDERYFADGDKELDKILSRLSYDVRMEYGDDIEMIVSLYADTGKKIELIVMSTDKNPTRVERILKHAVEKGLEIHTHDGTRH